MELACRIGGGWDCWRYVTGGNLFCSRQQKRESGGDDHTRAENVKGNRGAVVFFGQPTGEIWTGETPDISECVHDPNDHSKQTTRKCFAWNRPKGSHRREWAGNSEAHQRVGNPEVIAKCDAQNEAGSTEQINGGNMATPFMSLIRMPGVDNHDNGSHRVRNCEEDAILQCTESPAL